MPMDFFNYFLNVFYSCYIIVVGVASCEIRMTYSLANFEDFV